MDISSFTEAFSDITLQTPTLGVVISIFLVVFLLLLSGFASASEISFFSLSPADIADLDVEHSARDRKIEMLRQDSERTLATILITNNFVNVTVIMLCNFIFGSLIHFGPRAEWLEFLVLTVLLTFLLLLFGEIMPKVYSRQNPLIVDDLEQALELTDKEDIKDEQSMLQGIIRFGDETAKEVMTTRQDIVNLDIHSNFTEVLQCIVENNYSRIPVYQDNTDHIRGILYIKDLLPHLSKSATFRWQSLIRPPYFVPETKKIDDLLLEFQENKIHISIVVDDFGGTSGLITLEDILEEIVGEINDEYDDDVKSYTKIDDNTYIFEGKVLLSDFCKILALDDDIFDDVEGYADSLAGLLLELKGDFPAMHEKIDYQQFTFEILSIEARRISKIKVSIHPKEG